MRRSLSGNTSISILRPAALRRGFLYAEPWTVLSDLERIPDCLGLLQRRERTVVYQKTTPQSPPEGLLLGEPSCLGEN